MCSVAHASGSSLTWGNCPSEPRTEQSGVSGQAGAAGRQSGLAPLVGPYPPDRFRLARVWASQNLPNPTKKRMIRPAGRHFTCRPGRAALRALMGTRRWGEFLLHLRWGPVRPAGPDPTDGALLRRFADGRDEVAFALLVQRHGPTVFGVCCRILGPGPDAEDAFQATFVVLARRAAALADRAVVGNWLFGVARRTALKARAVAARRRAKERDMPRPESHPPNHAEELREAIDAAVAGLPTKYRAPVVLCELQGRSLREAAAELGWPEGTVAGRLSRGRAMLRARLVRAGLPAAAGVALTAPVPAALAAAAVRAGSAAAGGTGALPPAVAALAAGVQRQMALARLTPIAAVLGAALAAAGAITMSRGDRSPTPPASSQFGSAAEGPRRPAVDAFGDLLPDGA